MVSRYSTSTSIPRVDGLSKGPPGKGCHSKTLLRQNMGFLQKSLVIGSVVIKSGFFATKFATNSIATKSILSQ